VVSCVAVKPTYKSRTASIWFALVYDRSDNFPLFFAARASSSWFILVFNSAAVMSGCRALAEGVYPGGGSDGMSSAVRGSDAVIIGA
jgi:hypothetical protein